MSSPEHYVIGIDYGTLSGRAVVVRVSDGDGVGERGARVPPWRPRGEPRCRRDARRGAPAGLGAAGAARLRRGAAERGAGGGARQRDRPRRRDRDRHRLHRVHGAARPRRRHATVRGARAGRPPARLRQALEAPRGAGPRRPDQRARRRARRAVAGPLRRPDLVRVGVRQGSAAVGGRSRHLPADRALDRGRRLDRVAAQRCLRPQRVHRRLQGHPPGRRLPVARVPRRAQPGLRRLRRRQGRAPDRPARRSGRLADRRGGAAGPGSRSGSRCAPGTSTPT